MTVRSHGSGSPARHPPAAQRRERERERHRLEILECAGRLFADRGFERTTMQDISAESGFALASIYKHFPGKEQIYDALVSEAVRLYFEELQHRFIELDSPLDRIRAAVTVTFAHVERNRAVTEVVLGQLRGLGRGTADVAVHHGPTVFSARDGYRAVMSFFENLFSEARARGEIRPDVDPRDATLVLIGMLFTSLAYWLHYAGPDERMDAERLLRVVLGPVAAV